MTENLNTIPERPKKRIEIGGKEFLLEAMDAEKNMQFDRIWEFIVELSQKNNDTIKDRDIDSIKISEACIAVYKKILGEDVDIAWLISVIDHNSNGIALIKEQNALNAIRREKNALRPLELKPEDL